MTTWALHEGDCLDVLPTLEADAVGALITDPPAGIGFMNKGWDADRGGRGQWIAWLARVLTECRRVMKPGAYALIWALPRTSHWTGMAIEDAGLIPKDTIAHLFGSGFPKSLNLGDGYGTALKPAHEVWWLAQKPLDGTYAANVLRHGVGGLAIDACRVAAPDGVPQFSRLGEASRNTYRDGLNGSNRTGEIDTQTGRWPPNVLLTHSPLCADACHPSCPVAVLDAQSGTLTSGGYPARHGTKEHGILGAFAGAETGVEGLYKGTGGCSRFYPTFRFEEDDFAPFLYCAKAARSEREAGLGRLGVVSAAEMTGRKEGSAGLDSPRAGTRTRAGARNHHPTVKPVQLMRWLVRLVCPPGETCLDPFGGSGTTGVAALAEGREVILIEREAAYLPIIRRRLETTQPGLPLGARGD